MPRPVLIVNPRDDAEFGAYVEQRLMAGAESIEALQDALRERYPSAAVHRRELSGERGVVWYVYREGRWVPSVGCRLRLNPMPDLDDDLRATADDIAADAARLAAIESEKVGLDADDPRMVELSAESQRLATKIVPKTEAELDLAIEAQS